MVPFESFSMISYSHLIVTMALSCIVFEIKRDIGRKSSYAGFGGPCLNIASTFGMEHVVLLLQRGSMMLHVCH